MKIALPYVITDIATLAWDKSLKVYFHPQRFHLKNRSPDLEILTS